MIAAATYVERISVGAAAGPDDDGAGGIGRRDLVAMSRGLHAVLALHSPIRDRAGRSWCQGCSSRWHRIAWPCRTRSVVERELTQLGVLS